MDLDRGKLSVKDYYLNCVDSKLVKRAWATKVKRIKLKGDHAS